MLDVSGVRCAREVFIDELVWVLVETLEHLPRCVRLAEMNHVTNAENEPLSGSGISLRPIIVGEICLQRDTGNLLGEKILKQLNESCEKSSNERSCSKTESWRCS